MVLAVMKNEQLHEEVHINFTISQQLVFWENWNRKIDLS